ncbi:MAG: hypothetical protein JHC60_01340, partial [Sphingobium sp.]|nr:hypothetical protein [Sphingobium sp.]MBJ7375471.1 hypothetical protein [Sphingobium sp.]
NFMTARWRNHLFTIFRARNAQVLTVMVTNWAMKVGWEALLTPVTYLAVNGLKRREGLDVYDSGTDFTPFRTRL